MTAAERKGDDEAGAGAGAAAAGATTAATAAAAAAKKEEAPAFVYDADAIAASPRAEFSARRALERRKPKSNEIERVRELGNGNYSNVYLVRHRPSGLMLALKVLDRDRMRRLKMRHPHVMNEVLQEKKALLRLRGHCNIIRLVNTMADYKQLLYVMEFSEGGRELWSLLLEKDGRWKERAEAAALSRSRLARATAAAAAGGGWRGEGIDWSAIDSLSLGAGGGGKKKKGKKGEESLAPGAEAKLLQVGFWFFFFLLFFFSSFLLFFFFFFCLPPFSSLLPT